MSAKDSLKRYYERQLREQERERGPARKQNAKPEFEIQKAVMAWLKANGFSCSVVESKAVYSKSAGRYLNSQTEVGFPDLVGSCPNGIGCFIELKAPGRRSTLREAQRSFLMAKIELGCFAVCVDSVECVHLAWAEFSHRRQIEGQLAKAFLFRHLPADRDRLDFTLP